MKKVYVVIAVVGALIVAAVVGLSMKPELFKGGEPAETSEAMQPAETADPANHDTVLPSATVEPAAEPEPTAAPELVAPSFDVVRVSKEGDATIAGRGEPQAQVIILDNGTELGRATTDRRGEWVFVSPKPLTPGSHELSLKEILVNGETLESEDVVVVSVPESEKGKALAVKMDKDGAGAAQVLQGVEILEPGDLAIETIDHNEEGQFSVSGRAASGADVNVYVDNKYLGTARAGDDGHWSVSDERARLTMERHVFRADQVDKLNRVVARVEAIFEPGAPLTSQAKTLAIVRPGNSLWRIARMIYGTGPRYTTIYEANKEQIRDPDLIYPGQIFELPDAPQKAK